MRLSCPDGYPETAARSAVRTTRNLDDAGAAGLAEAVTTALLAEAEVGCPSLAAGAGAGEAFLADLNRPGSCVACWADDWTDEAVGVEMLMSLGAAPPALPAPAPALAALPVGRSRAPTRLPCCGAVLHLACLSRTWDAWAPLTVIPPPPPPDRRPEDERGHYMATPSEEEEERVIEGWAAAHPPIVGPPAVAETGMPLSAAAEGGRGEAAATDPLTAALSSLPAPCPACRAPLALLRAEAGAAATLPDVIAAAVLARCAALALGRSTEASHAPALSDDGDAAEEAVLDEGDAAAAIEWGARCRELAEKQRAAAEAERKADWAHREAEVSEPPVGSSPTVSVETAAASWGGRRRGGRRSRGRGGVGGGAEKG